MHKSAGGGGEGAFNIVDNTYIPVTGIIFNLKIIF